MLISIVLPCFNAQLTLPFIIKDVIGQTYTNWELLVVSNGIEQQSQISIANHFAENDNRIKIIRTEITGVSNARNIGILASKGDYIIFVDADDRISTDHLQLYVNAICERTDLVCGGFSMKRLTEHWQQDLLLHEMSQNDYSKKNIIEYLLTVWDNIVSSPCNILVSKDLIVNHDIYFDTQLSFNEDRLFNLSLLRFANFISVIKMTGYRYLIKGTDNATSKYHENFDAAIDKCWQLESCLLREIGYGDLQIKDLLLDRTYINTYFKICNLYKLCSPYSFPEKCNKIKAYLDNDILYDSFKKQNKGKHNILLRIFDISLIFHSTFIVALIFEIQYSIKILCGPKFGKIVKHLR